MFGDGFKLQFLIPVYTNAWDSTSWNFHDENLLYGIAYTGIAYTGIAYTGIAYTGNPFSAESFGNVMLGEIILDKLSVFYELNS